MKLVLFARKRSKLSTKLLLTAVGNVARVFSATPNRPVNEHLKGMQMVIFNIVWMSFVDCMAHSWILLVLQLYMALTIFFIS
jgi:hypothetical protein